MNETGRERQVNRPGASAFINSIHLSKKEAILSTTSAAPSSAKHGFNPIKASTTGSLPWPRLQLSLTVF
jgi:hypothetical protein